MLQLLVTANVVPSSPILVTVMMEAILFSKMLVLTSAAWHNSSEDGILHGHCHENLISYKHSGTLHIEKPQNYSQITYCYLDNEI
jgi:hypothetical protein